MFKDNFRIEVNSSLFIKNPTSSKLGESIVKEGRSVKSIQSDFNKTILAIQSELAAFKVSKGTPKAQTHVENLKKLNAIKNKLENELEDSVSSLYKDAELEIED